MDYKILWHLRARGDLRQLYKYLSGKNKSAANKIVSKIITRINLLITNPYLAAIDPLLTDMAKTYRSLVVGNYKVEYVIENMDIVIVYIWDCRRNPEELRESLE